MGYFFVSQQMQKNKKSNHYLYYVESYGLSTEHVFTLEKKNHFISVQLKTYFLIPSKHCC